MSENNKKVEPKTKSLDELLAKKKNASANNENDNMRSKMNRLKKANSVFDDTKALENSDVITLDEHNKKIEEKEKEKKKIEKDLSDANKKLKKLLALKYEDINVIDKKDNTLSKKLIDKMSNGNKEDLENKVKELEEKLKKSDKDLSDAKCEKQKIDEYVKGITNALNKTKEEKESALKQIDEIKENLAKVEEEKEANITAIASLNNQIKALEEENESAKNKENDYLSKDKEYEKYDARIEKANQEKAKEIEKNQLLNEKNKALKEELKNAKQESKDLNKEYTNKVKENNKLKLSLDKLNEAINKQIEDNNNLKQELEDANNKLKALSDDLDKEVDKNNLLLDVTSGLSEEFRNYEVKELEDKKAYDAVIKENEELKNKKGENIDESIDELNSEIARLKEELNSKNSEIEALKQGDQGQKIDELIQQLDSKDFEISQLVDEKRELTQENAVIPSLNDKIKELEEELSMLTGEINEYKQSLESEDKAIEASVYDELKEIQKECDEATLALEEALKEKEDLEKELEIAYTALKDQEEILDEQQKILDTQQFVIDQKMDDYKEKERLFKEKEKEFNLQTKVYDQDRAEYEEYKQISSAKQDDIFKTEDSIINLKKELDDALKELDTLREENSALKEEHKQQVDVVNQYLEDIKTSEKRIDDLVDTLAKREVDLDNYKNKLASLEKEYEDYKESEENNKQELENELEKLKAKLENINSDNEKLSISKFNESRLQSRIFELENNIKILSLKQDNNQENTLSNSLDQYRNLLANEREAHSKAEEKLSTELTSLRDQFNKLNEKLEKYTSNYYFLSLSKQISTINDINDDIKEGSIDINRDIYTKYYSDALKINLEQKEIYANEIEKRNEMLSNIKAEKEQELQELSQEADANVVRSFTYNKIRLLYKQVKDIDLLITSQIKSLNAASLELVEEEILKIYKKKLITYHRQMETNINNLEKSFNEKYDNIQTLDHLVETYENDCKEMALSYSREIEKLSGENKFDENPISTLIRDEKILLLANEFETLVSLRDKKYSEVSLKLQEKSKASALDSYNSSLVSYDALKQNLTDKMNQLEEEAKSAKNLILEEKKHIEEDISHLTDQLNQLNSFGDDMVVSEDRKKVKVLLAGKQERLDYLNTIKAVETEKHYDEMLTQIKNEFNEVLEDEEAAKSTYEKRSENLLQSSKIKMSASDNKTRLHTYENINKYLLNLDSIDDIFASLIKKREDIKKDASDDVEARTNLKANSLDFVKKYQSLWKLYDKYASAKKTMEEDIEDIRVYSALKNEASGTYRKFVNYQKSLNNLNERIRMGLDVDKNNELLRVNTAKANTLKNRVDYLNNRASDLLENENVSAYVELNNKMDEIIRLIKQMDNEFLKYMN